MAGGVTGAGWVNGGSPGLQALSAWPHLLALLRELGWLSALLESLLREGKEVT